MKKLLIVLMIIVPLYVFAEKAADKAPAKPEAAATEGERKPASEQELVQSRLRTADILARARIGDQICEMEAYQTEILDEVSKVQYRTGFSVSQIPASVTQALRGVIAYNEIATNTTLSESTTASQWTAALANSYWESMGMGVYGPQYKITLKAGGRVEIQRMEVLDQEPWYRIHNEVGSWTVQVRSERANSGPVPRLVLRLNSNTRSRPQVLRLFKNWENHGMWELRTGVQQGARMNTKFWNYHASECEV